jgi:hypothetical protein
LISIVDFPVRIQTSSQSVPSTPSWFGEVTMIAHFLKRQGVLSAIEEQVRFARRRFGHYDVIDFVAVLLGYAISGERTLETFYERVQPFANAFMALFGRERLPHRSTLSRFLAALDQATVEALRALFLKDLLARSLEKEEKPGGLWDRQGTHYLVFDVDGTRQAARQRALPCTPDLPPAQRRLQEVCAPGYTGRKRGEVVRTRTTMLQAHTNQWVGTFSGAGNGDYRGELRQAVQAISAYGNAHAVPLSQAVVRLDGQYGNGAIVADLAGLAYVMRGKDYGLLDLPQVQARLAQPPDQQTTHPETGTCRALFDCPDLLLTPTGPRTRVIVATHPATTTAAPIGTTRGEVVYELFFTALPVGAFTAADVVDLYLHRGAFETVLADEDQEQDPDRWCSHTAWGQEFWLILAQWIWNLRLELGHALHPTPMRTTEFASAHSAEPTHPAEPAHPVESRSYGPPQFARPSFTGGFAGSAFSLQSDGTLRCPASHPLYPQERRLERDGSLRLLYAARIGHCRPCPLREQCQGQGRATIKPRRVSAVCWPIIPGSPPTITSLSVPPEPPPAPAEPLPDPCPVLWGDWERRSHRRELVKLLRHQRVDVRLAETSPPAQSPPTRPLSRAERAHWRLSWAQRLARNAAPPASPSVSITLFGIPDAFAEVIGLSTL